MLEITLNINETEAATVTEGPKKAKATPKQSGYGAAILNRLEKQHYDFVASGDETIIATDPAGATTTITAANLDNGTFAGGNDYYIFAVADGDKSSYWLSPNKDFDENRLVGGFHYGKNRRTNQNLQPINASGKERGNGWEANVYDGILPHSVWTLARRPKCAPEGMVRLPTGLWVDIYQASDDGAGGLISAHNATPVTSKNWFDFSELALAKGKRLLTVNEWWQMAMGSPQGRDDDNTNAWTAEHNNEKQKTGYVANAVSSIGCRDAVGNVWEWTDTFTSDPDGGEWKWWDKMPGYGKMFMSGSTGLMALIAGGNWNSGVNAGARAVGTHYRPVARQHEHWGAVRL